MLMVALTSLRSDNEAMRLIISGRCHDGLQLAMARLEQKPSAEQLEEHAVLGQLAGHALIHMGHAETAEDLFRRQLRVYELGTRSYVRWMSSLDQGAMQWVMNKPGRSAHAYGVVADDDTAPLLLRIEALCGVAVSVRALGEYRRARHALQYAKELASKDAPPLARHIVDGLLLETEVLQQLRVFDEGGDLPSHAARLDDTTPLETRLLACASVLKMLPIAVQRLKFLVALIDASGGPVHQMGRQLEYINELRRGKLAELERQARVEAALAMLRAGDSRAMQELLGTLGHDEDAVRKQRHSLELRFCLSSIYAMQGRHADALRLYKDHVAQALTRLHSELSRLPYLSCLEHREHLEHADPSKLQLPLRYRRAYQYIIENLDKRDLSVREVAAHIDVTERSLQMVFRTHLGLSPGQLIRRRRVEHSRRDLLGSQMRLTLAGVAQRWGMSTCATLTQNYRQAFKETPSSLLRGQVVPVP